MLTVEFNTKEFERALREYLRHTSKDLNEAVDNKALDVALAAARETKKANAQQIRALREKEWWPKFIAKQFKGSRFTRKQAKEKSRKIIAARVRAINFVRAGWFEPARILARKLGKGLRIAGRKKSFGTAIPATPNTMNPTALIINKAQGIHQSRPGRATAGNGLRG